SFSTNGAALGGPYLKVFRFMFRLWPHEATPSSAFSFSVSRCSTDYSSRGGFGRQLRRSRPLKFINDSRLRCCIGGGIATAGDVHSAVAGVIIRAITLVQRGMFGDAVRVAELLVDELQIPVRSEVFGVNLQCLLELRGRLTQERLARGLVGIATFHLRPLKQCLAQFIDHLEILAEVEPSIVEFRIAIFKDAAKLTDRLVEITVLFVHK